MSICRRHSVRRQRRREPPANALSVARRRSSSDEGLRQDSLHVGRRTDDDSGSRLRVRRVLQALLLRRAPDRRDAAGGRQAGGAGDGETGRFHGHGRRLYGVPLQRKDARNDRVSTVRQSQPLCRLTVDSALDLDCRGVSTGLDVIVGIVSVEFVNKLQNHTRTAVD